MPCCSICMILPLSGGIKSLVGLMTRTTSSGSLKRTFKGINMPAQNVCSLDRFTCPHRDVQLPTGAAKAKNASTTHSPPGYLPAAVA
jgi:hypothetical protein